ncbi:Sas10p [Sugiyamaella lignohabitans]|uniref:Sas10p n=1 Tax=Sugiyamaella lignohabitans TaxID=796027 RepID=A0A161HFD3_9ASCO|nr:Sas10p [Sugiyamaella lignohabitans]ANB11211.1 Sas10p [Sugiyamaella lignohabitans]
MARKSRGINTSSRRDERDEEELDLDEIDQFHKNQEEILLDQAGLARKGRSGLDEEMEMSDEEVLGLDNDEEEDEEDMEMDDDALYGGNNEEDEEEEGWGSSKNNYYGADEPQDEESAKQEEQEALRLQKAHLAELAEDDYYEDEDLDEWKESAMATESDLLDSTGGVHHEALPEQDPTLLSETERLNLLQTWYPEVLPFIGELEKYSGLLESLKKTVKESENKIASIKFAALSSYLGTLSAYFALFVGTIENGKVSLKDHDVVKGILKARELWRLASNLDDEQDESVKNKSKSNSGSSVAVTNASSSDTADDTIWQSASEGYSSEDETATINSKSSATKRKRAALDRNESGSDSDSEFSVGAPVVKHVKRTRGIKSDYREEDIDEVSIADKLARKKSLRFYTSKIDQQTNKANNGREKFSGDADLPYKERHFERQQRLMEEARKRGLKTSGGAYDPADDFGSDDDNDRSTAKLVNDGFSEDYYNTIKAASEKRKEEKRNNHLLAKQAAKEGRLEELASELATDGDKRAINYQILKNKGLTPKRNKDNRNSRVKKRKRYEAAKKKLPSVRQVYKAPTSSYQGEQTGIKKNLIRSVRFAN